MLLIISSVRPHALAVRRHHSPPADPTHLGTPSVSAVANAAASQQMLQSSGASDRQAMTRCTCPSSGRIRPHASAAAELFPSKLPAYEFIADWRIPGAEARLRAE